jgi:hypothetical protein
MNYGRARTATDPHGATAARPNVASATSPESRPAMPLADSQFHLIDEIDARQDDVLGQLDALNDQIERLLAEFSTNRDDGAQPESLAEAA